MSNCISTKEPPYAERHVRWCERSENESRKKTTSFSSYSIFYVFLLRVYAPAVERLQDFGKGFVRPAVIEQPSDDACPSVGCPFGESERIWRHIPIEFDFTFPVRVLFPLLQVFNAALQGLVSDAFCVFHHLVVVFLAFDCHIRLSLSCCNSSSYSPKP